MASPDHITDLEMAVGSGELAPAQHLPNIPRFSDDSTKCDTLPRPLEERGPTRFQYNWFLIRKSDQPISEGKRLSVWGRFQLWFNTYR